MVIVSLTPAQRHVALVSISAVPPGSQGFSVSDLRMSDKLITELKLEETGCPVAEKDPQGVDMTAWLMGDAAQVEEEFKLEDERARYLKTALERTRYMGLAMRKHVIGLYDVVSIAIAKANA